MISRTTTAYRNAPIGVLDSGFGGLSILHELQKLLPHEDFIFFADQGHVPYGEKSLAQVQAYVEGITRFFLSADEHLTLSPVKLIVIACNTASAAALHHSREMFPFIQFVGMEPAVKPAAQHTQTGHIGVLATRATFQGELYASLIDRFARNIEVHTRACPDFVMLVERGGPYDDSDYRLVRQQLTPLVEANIDQIVLGCTHFPFLTPLIQAAVGPSVQIVDPSPAVANQTHRVLHTAHALTTRTNTGNTIYITSGDPTPFRQQVQTLMNVTGSLIHHAAWTDTVPALARV